MKRRILLFITSLFPFFGMAQNVVNIQTPTYQGHITILNIPDTAETPIESIIDDSDPLEVKVILGSGMERVVVTAAHLMLNDKLAAKMRGKSKGMKVLRNVVFYVPKAIPLALNAQDGSTFHLDCHAKTLSLYVEAGSDVSGKVVATQSEITCSDANVSLASADCDAIQIIASTNAYLSIPDGHLGMVQIIATQHSEVNLKAGMTSVQIIKSPNAMVTLPKSQGLVIMKSLGQGIESFQRVGPRGGGILESYEEDRSFDCDFSFYIYFLQNVITRKHPIQSFWHEKEDCV